MKWLTLIVLLSLMSQGSPSFASSEAVRSAPTAQSKVLVESSKPPRPECAGLLRQDCTGQRAYDRIDRLSDNNVRGIIREYRRFFTPLLASCYQNANASKSLWQSNCGHSQEREFVEALFREPAQIGTQGAPVASSVQCIPKYKELLQQAYNDSVVRRNAVKGINAFLNLMTAASFIREYKTVIPEVVLNGVKIKFSGTPHKALIVIATHRSNWNRAKQIETTINAEQYFVLSKCV